MLEPIETNTAPVLKLWRRYRWPITLIVLGSAIVLSLSVWASVGSDPKEAFEGLPHSYTYLETDSPGKLHLHMMSVAPEDIVLRTIHSPLRPIASYGINGGFFYGSDLLSIAMMNDNPANGAQRAYGSGWFNAKYPRGTLVWDGVSRVLSVQTVSSADELAVIDRSHYWAQGGISMNLQQEELWEAAAAEQHLPLADEKRMRSGMIFDDSGKVWLIVTPTLCTAEDFREAIRQTVPAQGLEGIFLDGDGSSQMNADEAVLTGDSRPVVQMIAVRSGE